MRALTNVIGKNCCSSLLLSTRLPFLLLLSTLLLMSFCGGGARGGGTGQGKGWGEGWGNTCVKLHKLITLTLQTRAIREIHFCVSRRKERNRLALESKRDTPTPLDLLPTVPTPVVHPHIVAFRLLEGHKHKVQVRS